MERGGWQFATRDAALTPAVRGGGRLNGAQGADLSPMSTSEDVGPR